MRRYYEFAIVVVLIGVISLALMRSLESASLSFEEALVQSTAASMRMELIEVVTHREAFGGELPRSNNPVDWVSVRPANYQGAFDTAPAGRSIWYFDRPSNELVFRFRDDHCARFRLTREGSVLQGRAVIAGVGLLRLEDRVE